MRSNTLTRVSNNPGAVQLDPDGNPVTQERSEQIYGPEVGR